MICIENHSGINIRREHLQLHKTWIFKGGETDMSIIGFIFGILSFCILLLTIIPFLGWINWLNLPFAILGLIFCLIGVSSGKIKGLGIAGIVICCTVIILGMLRLQACGGFI